jgi:cytochrome c oxidase subunit 1
MRDFFSTPLQYESMAITVELVITVLMAMVLLAMGIFLSRFENVSYTGESAAGGYGGEEGHAEKLSGVARWLTTVDHKDIGILYGVFSTITFAWGGVGVILMRTELLAPKMNIMNKTFYNALMTTHGLTMLFLFATPMIAAFVNYTLPLILGADDLAFPRINAVAFWMLPPATILVWSGFLLIPFGITPATTGWTMYAPLSIKLPSISIDLMILGLHLSGISTTMSAINFITTIFTKRADDISWANLDIFSWTVLAQSGLILFAFPLLGAALIMLLLDRNFGTTFFVTEGGGPLLWQHLFWFFGHPEVYILVLPPMGLVSYILPKFSGRKLFGFKFVVYSTLAIGVLSYGVWAHHMFTTGLDPRLAASFMAVSVAIAVPSAVKVFNWIATLWDGRLRMAAPMLFCLGFIQNFIIGGVTGVFLAAIPFNYLMQGTYYVIGHFHLIIFGAIVFALFGASYYWFPLVTGRMYNKRLSRWHFWLSIVGSNVAFLAMLILGYQGMPRRYATYLPQFTFWHQVATIGAYLMFIGGIIWVWNLAQSAIAGPQVSDEDPWNLRETNQLSREWNWFERKRQQAIPDGGDENDIETETAD